MIGGGKLMKKEVEKMKFTAEELSAIPLAVLLYDEKKIRKMFHIRKIYAFFIMIWIGAFFFFFSMLAITMLVLYAFIISNLAGRLIILPFFLILLFALILFLLALIKRFSEKFRLFFQKKEKLKGPIIIYEGECY